MAYITQDQKREIAALMKVELKGMNVKYSLSIQNNMGITCTISAGDVGLDPENRGSFNVNHYYIERSFTGVALEILTKIRDCLNHNNYDRSDSQSDYFDVGHYINIQVGKYNKPFQAI